MFDKKNKLDKAFEEVPVEDLVSAPTAALQGVSDRDGEKLKRSFGLETIRDMAECEWYLKALAVKRKAQGE